MYICLKPLSNSVNSVQSTGCGRKGLCHILKRTFNESTSEEGLWNTTRTLIGLIDLREINSKAGAPESNLPNHAVKV
jgi:hypothetical protein